MKIFKTIFVSFFISFLFFSTGCWDRNEIDQLAVVLAAGIDRLDQGEYELSVQVVNPTKAERGKGTSKEASIILSSKGKTVAEAVDKFISIMPRHIFWGQTKMLVFGENVARQGVRDIYDWFERYREFRFPFVFTTTGKAKDIIAANLPLENISGMGMQELINHRRRHLTKVTTTLNEFSEQFFTPSKVSYSTRLGLRKQEKQTLIQVLGLSFFKNGKLFTNLSNEQVLDFLILRSHNLSGGSILIPCINEVSKYTAIDIEKNHTKITPKMINNQLIYEIKVNLEGAILSTDCQEKINTKEQIKKLENRLNGVIKKRMTNLIKLAQKDTKIDFLRFDEELKKQDLTYWREVKEQWDEIFPTIKTEINVHTHIRRIQGATNDPIMEEQ